MDQNQNNVNSFLDSMDGTDSISDSFAAAEERFSAPITQATPNAPTSTWPTQVIPNSQPVIPVSVPEPQVVQQQVAPPEVEPNTTPIPAQPTSPTQQSFAVISGNPRQTQQPADPFELALKNAEAQQSERLIEVLKAKKPFFSYGKATDEIEDSDTTFEALREKYEADFPELSDSKLVTWSVSYGKVTKQISNPASDKVYTVKSEIEKSKTFLDGLKKAKTDAEKNPECLVKPFKKAQSKGDLKFPAYKEFAFTKADAMKSEKSIVLLPSKDGRLFEIRKNEIGVFTAPVTSVNEFDGLTSDFRFALPKIPYSILTQTLSFFKQLSDKYRFEALVHILYDTELQNYCIKVPKQKITAVSVDSESEQYGERFIHVMDIHSHNSMPAVFSQTDDKDEKSTRLYAVAGRFDRMFPELTVRAGCGGKFIPIEPSTVFELEEKCSYPDEWNKCLKVPKTHIPKKFFFRKSHSKQQLQNQDADFLPF